MFRRILCVLALLGVSACSWFEVPPELDSAARRVFVAVRDLGVEDLRASATNAAEAMEAERKAAVIALIPKVEPDAVRQVGYSWVSNFTGGGTTYTLTHEYAWPDKVVLFTANFAQASAEQDAQFTTYSFRIATREELKVHDFTLTGKSPLHYLMLLAPIAAVALMVVAIVMAIRTPEVERRWLWCIISLVTVCGFELDWTTGAFDWMLLKAGLINQGVSQAGTLFAPWTVSTSIPLGAFIVIFRLWRRGKEVREAAASS